MISKKCPNCGKTAAEIRKAWKEGMPLDKDAKRRRLEELESGVLRSDWREVNIMKEKSVVWTSDLNR